MLHELNKKHEQIPDNSGKVPRLKKVFMVLLERKNNEHSRFLPFEEITSTFPKP
jgi:hypothetical protein